MSEHALRLYRVNGMPCVRWGYKLTVLGQQVLEEVQVEVLLGSVLCNGYEEAYQEDDDNEKNEANGVFEGAPETAASSLRALLCGNVITLLVPEVSEGNNDQAQDGIQAVQGVVDDLELEQDVVDGIRSGPIFLSAEFGGSGRRYECYIDG